MQTKAFLFLMACSMLFGQARINKKNLNPEHVPGLKVIEQTSPATLVLQNLSGKRIVGLSTKVTEKNGHSVAVELDGLDTIIPGVAPGELIVAAKGFMQAGDGKLLSPPLAKDEPTEGQVATLEWVLFEDGAFYGNPAKADTLLLKRQVRVDMYEKLLTFDGIPAKEQYIRPIEKCGQNIECARATGKSAEEWNEINHAITSYRDHGTRLKGDVDTALKRLLAGYAKYPKTIRVMTPELTTVPDDTSDGWFISTYKAYCNLYGPAFQNDQIYGGGYATSTTDPSVPCEYETVNIPPNYMEFRDDEDLTVQGYVMAASALCSNTNAPDVEIAIGAVEPNGGYMGFSQVPEVVSQDQFLDIPPFKAEARIQTNYAASWAGADSVTFGLAFGWTDSVGYAAPDPGISCAVYFTGPFDAYSGNYWPYKGFPVSFQVPSVFLSHFNTSALRTVNDFGYEIANYSATENCLFETTITQKVSQWSALAVGGGMTGQQPIIFNRKPEMSCAYQSMASNGGGGGPSCDFKSDCCCCVNAYGVTDFCDSVCLGSGIANPIPWCDTQADTAAQVLVSSQPQNVTVKDSLFPPTTSTQMCIDSPSSGATISGTTTISGWVIPSSSYFPLASVSVKVDGAPSSAIQSISWTGYRPDVCWSYPGRDGCPNVGLTININTTLLSNGIHSFAIKAIDGLGNSTTQTLQLAVHNGSPSPVTLFLDSPTDGAVVSGIVNVRGWVASYWGPYWYVGFNVDNYGTTGDTNGWEQRPDVCEAYPGIFSCLWVGFADSFDSRLRSNGPHTLKVQAGNYIGDPLQVVKTITVYVSN